MNVIFIKISTAHLVKNSNILLLEVRISSVQKSSPEGRSTIC